MISLFQFGGTYIEEVYFEISGFPHQMVLGRKASRALGPNPSIGEVASRELNEMTLMRVGAGRGQMRVWVCKALRLSPVTHLSGDMVRRAGTAPERGCLGQRRGWWRLQPPNHKGALEGSWSLGSLYEASKQ